MAKFDIWVRHIMDRETKRLISGVAPETKDVCEVSGSVWADIFPWKSYTTLAYPEFDVCLHKFPQKFDLIIVEQVFEHLRYPWRAIQNIFDWLNPDGHVLITVPFLFHIHPTPLDCWRWTPQGLGFMLEDGGFRSDEIITGGWGNYECFLRHAIDQTSAPAMNSQFSLENIPHIPMMVWAFGHKRPETP